MTGWPVALHAEAVLEAHQAARWYAARSVEAADAFLKEIDHATSIIRLSRLLKNANSQLFEAVGERCSSINSIGYFF